MISFSDLPLHPAVATALARREYATATPVQAAVVAPEIADRDLLVSAPTGSGKTVAFGTLVAAKLLGGEAPVEKKKGPRALVIAPTRELSNQVSGELAWLFADARLSTGSFTGGTSVPGDLRRLRSGLDVVVGTPGRLVDLHERGSLSLADLEVIVLDEADEMLDLGFREALEHLLGQAPKERRTLLFSATLPPEIVRLATTYQRNAIRIDPRAGGAVAPHADIEHFAHLVRPQDRLAAVVNVLAAAGNAKAIVFVRTREGVGDLHQRLVDHGFRAVAMSGDRAQNDRDRALAALRSGRARILVATNVAARGLDLPDVELVLHADLPENAEALTHRSGRTGRAGRKGRSVVIADVRERRKAERLLHGARTQARWTPAPTAADVRRALVEGLREELVEAMHDRKGEADGAAEDKPADALAELADRLRAALPERVLIAELLARELARLPSALSLEPLDPNKRPEPPRMTTATRVGRGERDDRPAPAKPAWPPGPGWTEAVVFEVNLGASAKAEPGWLLPLICRRGGVTRREVGAIRVGAQSSTFEIAAEAAADFALSAAERDPRAPHVTIAPVGNGARGPANTDEAPAPRKAAPARHEPGVKATKTATTKAAKTATTKTATTKATKTAAVATAPTPDEAPAVEAAPVIEAPVVVAPAVIEAPVVVAPPVSETPVVVAAPVIEAPVVVAAPEIEAPVAAPAPVAPTPAKAPASAKPAPAKAAAPAKAPPPALAADELAALEDPAAAASAVAPVGDKPKAAAAKKRPRAVTVEHARAAPKRPPLETLRPPQAPPETAAAPSGGYAPPRRGRGPVVDRFADGGFTPPTDRPAYGKPGGPRGGDRPAFARGGDKPAFARGGDGPGFSRGGDRPAFARGGDRPAFGKPGGKPAFGKPAFGKPAFGKPGGKPGFSR